MILGVRELYGTSLAPDTVSESSLLVKQFSSAMISQDAVFKETASDKAILISERFQMESPLLPAVHLCTSVKLFKESDWTVTFAATDFPLKQVTEFNVTCKAVLCDLLHSRLEMRWSKDIALSYRSALMVTAWSLPRRGSLHYLA